MSLVTWYLDFLDVLRQYIPLTLASQPSDVRVGPTTELQGDTFSVLIDSDNTDDYSDNTEIRLHESVIVRYVIPVSIDGTTEVNARIIEQRILQAVGDQSLLPTSSVLYRRTRRYLSPAHEYWLTDIYLTIDHDFSWSS